MKCNRGRGTFLFGVCALLVGLALAACMTEANTGDDDDDPQPGSKCGNMMCETGETVASCASDCKPTCGNMMCEAGETVATCAADCAKCGNNMCETGETPASCPADCTAPPVCGDKVCAPTETATTCAIDCTATLRLENHTGYTLYNVYARTCGGGWSTDLMSGYLSNGYYTTITDIPPGCWQWRAGTYNNAQYWQTTDAPMEAGKSYTWAIGN